MFGFQKFTHTADYICMWFGVFILSGVHLAVFSEYVNCNTLMVCIASLFLLLLALLVGYISSKVVVVYWDGELEDVSKDMFITALKNDSIPLIDCRGFDLDAFMYKCFFLSSKEIELMRRKIAQIKLEVSEFKVDLEEI